MIDLFTHKQMRCKYCEFEFSLIGFGNAAEIVCPMCGEDNGSLLPLEEKLHDASPTDSQEKNVTETQEPGGVRPPVSPVPPYCSVEHCPLLTGGASDKAVAEQLGLRIQAKRKRRRTILAWTILIQVCILTGTALFLVQTRLMHKDNQAVNPVVTVEIEPVMEPASEDVSLPEYAALSLKLGEQVEPAHAEVENRIAQIGNSTDNESSIVYKTSHHSGFPHEEKMVPETPLPPPSPSDPPMIATSEYVETTPLSPLLSLDPDSLEMADALLELAKTTLAENPEECVTQITQAAQIYEQHGYPLPQSMYWTLSNAYASLAWGEPLLESSPAIEVMTLSPDSRYLLAQLRDKTVRVWDLQSAENGRSAYLLDSGTAEYVKFIFTSNLRWIIGGQKNGIIRIWDMSLRNPAESVITLTERVPDLQDIQISLNGQWLAAFGHASKGINVAETQPVDQLIRQVNYQRERSKPPRNSSPYPVLLWNLRPMEAGGVPTATPVASASQQPVQVIRFSPNSDKLAIGRKDAVVGVYDLTTRGINNDPLILRGHQLGVTQIAFAPHGNWMATGSQDNTIRLWDLSNSAFAPEPITLYGHRGWISTLSIDASGEYIVSGSYDRTIRIWNVRQDRLDSVLNRGVTVLETSLGIPESLLVTQDGDKLIALGTEGSLGVYHLPSLMRGDPDAVCRSVTFRNSKLSISKCLLTGDDQCLIFSYEHLLDPANSGLRLWSLTPYSVFQ